MCILIIERGVRIDVEETTEIHLRPGDGNGFATGVADCRGHGVEVRFIHADEKEKVVVDARVSAGFIVRESNGSVFERLVFVESALACRIQFRVADFDWRVHLLDGKAKPSVARHSNARLNGQRELLPLICNVDGACAGAAPRRDIELHIEMHGPRYTIRQVGAQFDFRDVGFGRREREARLLDDDNVARRGDGNSLHISIGCHRGPRNTVSFQIPLSWKNVAARRFTCAPCFAQFRSRLILPTQILIPFQGEHIFIFTADACV